MPGVALGCMSLGWVVLGGLSQKEIRWWRRLLQITEHDVNRVTPDGVLF